MRLAVTDALLVLLAATAVGCGGADALDGAADAGDLAWAQSTLTAYCASAHTGQRPDDAAADRASRTLRRLLEEHAGDSAFAREVRRVAQAQLQLVGEQRCGARLAREITAGARR